MRLIAILVLTITLTVDPTTLFAADTPPLPAKDHKTKTKSAPDVTTEKGNYTKGSASFVSEIIKINPETKGICSRIISDDVGGKVIEKFQFKLNACDDESAPWVDLQLGPMIPKVGRMILSDGVEIGLLSPNKEGTLVISQLCTGIFKEICKLNKTDGKLVGFEKSLNGMPIEKSITKFYSRGNDDEEVGESNYETAKIMTRLLVLRNPTTGKKELWMNYSGQMLRDQVGGEVNVGRWGLVQRENTASPTTTDRIPFERHNKSTRDVVLAEMFGTDVYFGKNIKLGEFSDNDKTDYKGTTFVEGPDSSGQVKDTLQQQKFAWSFNPSSNTASTTLEQQDTRQLAKKIKNPPDTRGYVKKFLRFSIPAPDTTFTARADFLPLIYSSETSDKTTEKLISRDEAEKARGVTTRQQLIDLVKEMQVLSQRIKDERK